MVPPALPACKRFSDNEINSPKLTLGFDDWAAGETSCWRICFFSAAFFLTGVELLRFLRGDGEPVRDYGKITHREGERGKDRWRKRKRERENSI